MISIDESTGFKSYVVIEIDKKCDSVVKSWLIAKLTAPKDRNGAELEVQLGNNAKNEEIFLHISASFQRFLKGAEEIRLKKECLDGKLRDFLCQDLKSFKNSDNEYEFLSQSERLKIIEYELNSLKHDLDEFKVSNLVIYAYDGIINQLKNYNLIRNVFPLHDKNALKRLESSWYKNLSSYGIFKRIPIDEIRAYFGESIGFYFRFFEFYTKGLYSFAAVGLLTWFLPISAFKKFMIAALFNMIWNTVIIEAWKRESNSICFKWGLFDLDTPAAERPRPQFHGEPGRNSVTGKFELVYSKKKRRLQKYLVSYPTIGLAIFIAFLIMMAYYSLQHFADSRFNSDSYFHLIIRILPSILYSFVVLPLNIVYKLVSVYLTDWENHRTQSSYESNLTTKLFVFYFANCFMCLFYEAFFEQNYYNLSSLLVSMLITNAAVNKLLEVFAPYVNKKIKKKILKSKDGSEVEKQAHALEQYDGTYNDYVTLFEQYGYITLFSSVFPWISVAALANNIAEQRSDAFKYCHVHQRPFPACTQKGIGPWLNAFELLGMISVMTNLALIALHPEVRDYFGHLSDLTYFIYFVLLEHAVIVIKVVIMTMIPNEPLKITQAKQRYYYELLEALRNSRLEKL